MRAIVISISPGTVSYTPLRRALPAPDTQPAHAPRTRRVSTMFLVAAGLVAFLDVELGLAYLLHFAARMLG